MHVVNSCSILFYCPPVYLSFSNDGHPFLNPIRKSPAMTILTAHTHSHTHMNMKTGKRLEQNWISRMGILKQDEVLHGRISTD